MLKSTLTEIYMHVYIYNISMGKLFIEHIKNNTLT